MIVSIKDNVLYGSQTEFSNVPSGSILLLDDGSEFKIKIVKSDLEIEVEGEHESKKIDQTYLLKIKPSNKKMLQ